MRVPRKAGGAETHQNPAQVPTLLQQHPPVRNASQIPPRGEEAVCRRAPKLMVLSSWSGLHPRCLLRVVPSAASLAPAVLHPTPGPAQVRARPRPCCEVTKDPFAFSTKIMTGSQSCSRPHAPDPCVPVSPCLCVFVSLGPHVLSLSSLHSCGFNPWASAPLYLCIPASQLRMDLGPQSIPGAGPLHPPISILLSISTAMRHVWKGKGEPIAIPSRWKTPL